MVTPLRSLVLRPIRYPSSEVVNVTPNVTPANPDVTLS